MHRARCIVALACGLGLHAQVAVLTYQYDTSRAGANRNESILNPANVNSAQFGKLFSYAVDGYVYAQPLYLPSVAIPGKETRNIVFTVTEQDSVYAFDADGNSGPAPLWHVNFLNPGAGVTTVAAGDTGCSQIVPEIGITSTPVIDAASGTLYTVAMTKEMSSGTVRYVQRLHALDVTTGGEKPGSPVEIQATFPGTGEGGTSLVFNPRNYKQRPGLLLLNGVVYTAWSSHCDIGRYHGWLIGYDAQTLRQVSVYNSTPNGNQGSFWSGGAAPAADTDGNIYVVSGNGSFDRTPDLGESYIKLSTANGVQVADYFAPFNYQDLNDRDLDTGSAGVVLLGDEAGGGGHTHLMAGAGKEGRIYVLDRDNLGKVQAGSDSQIVQSVPGAFPGLFGNPAYFNKTLYFCPWADQLKAYSVSNGRMSTTPVSQSAATFGAPGCVPTISANGTADGIVWALDMAGVLRAYDAGNLGRELYNSDQNRTRDALGGVVKFSPPTVANGKVYAGTQTSLVAYGLLSGGSPGSLGVSNAASGDATAVAPGSIASLYGTGLATTTARAASFPVPTSLGGATVTVNGVAAPIFYASSTQVNFQIPYETAAGNATVVTRAGTAAIPIRAVAPGIFVQPDGNAAVLNADGSIHSDGNPAAAGSEIAVFLTGLGAANPAVGTGAAAPVSPLSRIAGAVTASVGGNAAAVEFAGLAPGYAGLYQVNITLPQLAPGHYPLQITLAGASSNSAQITIR